MTAVVRYTFNGLVRAHLAEALCFGIGIGFVTVASALLSGAVGGIELGALGVGLGCMGAAAWGIGTRSTVADMARRLDRKLRFEGALVTAFELEESGGEGPLAALLSQRVRGRLRRAEALRLVLPPIAPPLAAVLLGLASWLLVLDREGPVLAEVDVAGLVQGARARLVQARTDALDALDSGELEPVEAQAWIDAVGALDDLSPDLEAEELDRLDRALANDALGTNSNPALASELEQARAQIDAARSELERRDQAENGDSGTSGAGPLDAGLTNNDPVGMMSGSTEAAGRSTENPTVAPSLGRSSAERAETAVERATFSAWWPTEYNGLVRAWVDRPR